MKQKAIALIRVDSNYHVGMGHIMRCVALAHELKRKGLSPLFLVRDYNAAKAILDGNFMRYICIPRKLTLDNEINYVKVLIKKHRARTLIIDRKSNNDIYGDKFKSEKIFLVRIVDSQRVKNSRTDLTVAAESYYTDKQDRVMRGMSYVITGKDSFKYNKLSKKIKSVKNIALSFGGGDNSGVFFNVISALEKFSGKVKINLALGATFSRYSLLGESIEKTKLKIDIFKNVRSMAKFLHNSDIAFISGGATKYEAACVGTPSFIIAQGNTQLKYSERFARQTKAAICLGRYDQITVGDLQKKIVGIFSNKRLLREMSDAGRIAVDGLGARRVADRIVSCGRS